MKRYFLLRVELHNLPTPKEMDSRTIYDKLHEELLARNYYKEVRGNDDVDYKLPDAVYEGFTTDSEEKFTGANARSIAKSAIDDTIAFVKETLPLTKLRGSILVAEVAGTKVFWRGLNQA